MMDVKSSPVNERIIPITILDGPHGIKPFQQGPLTPPPSPSQQATSSSTDSNSNSKRQSLLVTLDDGTTTETQGTVTNLSNNNNNNNVINNKVTIQEIGQETLERELSREKQVKTSDVVETSSRKNETKTSEVVEPSSRKNETKMKVDEKKVTVAKASPKEVRHVPIRLDDGKVIQREPDEKMEIRSEFTNYTHEEILDHTHGSSSPNSTAKKSDAKSAENGDAAKVCSPKERIIPIRLETGEEIMPLFTKLEDPEPPKWSTFSKTNKNNQKPFNQKEKIVPIKVETDSDPLEERGRKRTKNPEDVGPSSSVDGDRRSSRSMDRRQHTVRFNVNEEKQERRSESRESFTRRTTTNRNTTKGKPPPAPSDRHSYTSGDSNRKPSYTNSVPGSYRSGSPSLKREPTPDNDQKTLLDIDRDITRIWKELQELDTTKPSKYPATPVKVRSFTIPTATQAERVSRATPPPPPLSSSLPTSSGTPRTIWDSNTGPYSSSFVPQQDNVEAVKVEHVVRGGSFTNLRNGTSQPLKVNKPEVQISCKGTNPFVSDPDEVIAPLASAEPSGSPVSPEKSQVDNNNVSHKKSSTSDFDDGAYEGVEIRTNSPFRKSKRQKSESPTKNSRKSESPKKGGISSEIQTNSKFTDKATQTGQDDEESKKSKKSGNCIIL